MFFKYHIQHVCLFVCLICLYQDTFNTLFGIYCEQGNTAAADKLLDFVKKCNIPLTSSVYAAMITGHSRVGELDQAKALLESLKVKGQAPTTVYCSLLCAYAEKGLVESIKEVINYG